VHASILRNHWKVIQKAESHSNKANEPIGRGST
jgi:hypothetical protein